VHALTADGRTVFGKIERCRHTGCFADSHARYRKGEHYLGMLGLATTPTMAEWRQVLGTEDSYAAVIALATGNTAPPMLLIYGGTGNGKSHLCNALGLALHERGIGVRLWRAPDMLAYLKAGMQDSSEDRRLDMIKAVPALILDDWGANYDTDWAKSRLDDLVGARYESNRRGERKVTVMTTNLDVSQLPPRVESRFADKDLSVTVLNRGADRRVEK
jgi:chromosomal replication initiation ATPase DnaA